MFAVFLALLFFIMLAIAAYDFLPDILNWTGRIKTGILTNDEEWLENIKYINLRWLFKGAPKVLKNENQRLRLITDIKNFKKVSPICYWQDAALLKAAASDCGEETAECVKALLERYINVTTGEWIEKPEKIDCAILAYEMLSNEFIDNESIKPAVHTVAEMLKEYYDEYGYIPYNRGIPEINFVDTVGMVCPFLIKYAYFFDKPKYADMAIKQIGLYYKLAFDEKSKLPFHCYDVKSGNRLGISGWGRGCGWWAVGIVDSLKEILNFEGFDKEKLLLVKLCISFLDNFEKYISENGAVNRMVLNSSLQDSSASAMFAYCYAYVYSLTNKTAYRRNAEKILGYLKHSTRRNGVIDYSQGDTMGIGFYSSKLTVVPAAQGFTISAVRILN